jgi:hypothetical protein
MQVLDVLGLVAIASAATSATTTTAAVATAATSTAAATAAAAAAEAATPAASTTSAAAEAAATATTTAAAATLFARTRFVDSKGSPAMFLAVESGHRSGRLIITAHLDEAEAFASTGVAIVDDLGGYHRAVLTKQLLEFRAVDLIAQVPDVKLLTHLSSPVNG